jgi:hypothetical protein
MPGGCGCGDGTEGTGGREVERQRGVISRCTTGDHSGTEKGRNTLHISLESVGEVSPAGSMMFFLIMASQG